MSYMYLYSESSIKGVEEPNMKILILFLFLFFSPVCIKMESGEEACCVRGYHIYWYILVCFCWEFYPDTAPLDCTSCTVYDPHLLSPVISSVTSRFTMDFHVALEAQLFV